MLCRVIHGGVFLALSSLAVAQTTFEVPLALPAGNQPEGIDAADLDADGDVDLVLSNSGDHRISVLLNDGTGSYVAAGSYVVGFRPKRLILADLDGDSDADVAVANQNSGTVSIRKNDGSAVFSSHSTFATQPNPQFVAAGDLDGDLDLDLAVAAGSSTLSLLYNDGGATFSAPSSVSVGGTAWSVAIGDLDDDGDNDLAATRYSGEVAVLLNGGGGTFGPPSAFETGPGAVELTLVDLDGIGGLDIATANAAAVSVSVLLNLGGAAFAPPVQYRTGDQFTAAKAIRHGDMDADGDEDLVVVNGPPIGSGVSVLFNSGNGQFAPPLNLLATDSGFGSLPVVDVVVAQLDDGRLDFAAAGSIGTFSGVMLTYNRPAIAMFAPARQFWTGRKPVSVAAADLDGDADQDLAVVNEQDGQLAILFNSGNALFSWPFTYPAGISPSWVTAGDFDGDGDIDLATPDRANSTDRLHVHWNDGTGSFPTKTLIGLTTGFLANAGHVANADLDGDGDLDIVTADTGASHVSVILNQGGGSFAAAVPYDAGTRPREVQPADVDADGDFDLVVASLGNSAVVLVNAGDGTFGPETYKFIGKDQFSIPVADLDGDLDLDFVTSLNATGLAAASFNDGLGGFPPATRFFGGYSLGESRALTADFDRDGDVDVAIANRGVSNVSVLRNRGDGVFGLPLTYAVGYNPLGLASADLDGDGDLDLAVANAGAQNVSVLRNRTVGFLRIQ